MTLLCLATTARGQTSVNQFFAFVCNPDPTCPDGIAPSNLLQSSDGNFCGTTPTSIFRLTASGQLTVLYVFKTNPKTGF